MFKNEFTFNYQESISSSFSGMNSVLRFRVPGEVHDFYSIPLQSACFSRMLRSFLMTIPSRPTIHLRLRMSHTLLCGRPAARPERRWERSHIDVVYDEVDGSERSNTNHAKEGIPRVVLGERAVSRLFFFSFWPNLQSCFSHWITN